MLDEAVRDIALTALNMITLISNQNPPADRHQTLKDREATIRLDEEA